ncbi:SipW-dependent-type signal peptide-containing protein [Haloglomus halophilum]|uniref:SipW-dependent-type signal peptide-containing protein n=1 Tax=Haloglomus halophilum TaxID=2962672 RepID=UPI0020C9A0B4|nr:SipW-dependent-type signal peptide-containing protein [Haloglomus halophilum]
MSNNDDIGNDSQLYNLSRRKVLAGMGAVGLASVGAGLGTSALFSDTESFEGNSITAGTLDMLVTAEAVAASPYWEGQVSLPQSITSEDAEAAEFSLEINDVKPGDWGIICFDIENETNPGYVQVSVPGGVINDGGTNPEPEQEAEGGNGNSADLGDAMLASIWQAYTDNDNGRDDLSVLDPWTNDESSSPVNKPYAAVSQDDFEASDYGQTVESDMDYPTLNELGSFLSGGQLIRNDDGTPFQVGYDDGTGDPAVGDGKASFCLLLEIPAAVGNEIQGDSVTFDLVFETEQVRNNPSPFDGDPNNGTPTPSA